MVKKKLTKEEKEDKAIANLVKFANEHTKAFKALQRLTKKLNVIGKAFDMLEEINDKVEYCDMLLRREDSYIKQVAKELGIRLERRRE